MQDNPTAGRFPQLRETSVVVADGFGIHIHVDRRHLVVADGLGRHRREQRYARATSKIRRLVVLGNTGSVSLEALRWLDDLEIAFIHIARDGRVLTESTLLGLNDARLRRAQALAMTTPAGLAVTHALLRQKIEGQRDLSARLPDADRCRSEIDRSLLALNEATSVNAALIAEASAANAYWSAWQTIPVTFARKDHARIPDHWRTFGKRGSPHTSGPRLAANPPNAIVNYLYSLLEAESRLACLAVGLDAGLGIFHADQKSRDSLALDVMEAARPAVDAYVLELLMTRTLRAADFHETPQGVCRILPPLTHYLAESMPLWAKAVAPVAEHVAQAFAKESSHMSRVPTPITQANRRAARDEVRRRSREASAKPRLILCRSCGVVLASAKRLYCDDCGRERQAEVLAAFKASGPARLEELRDQGTDPSGTEEARKKLGGKNAMRMDEAWEWDRKHTRPDRAVFVREILPHLQEVPVRKIAAATGLSRHYCSRIRRGIHVPHPRHWNALRTLGV